MADIARASPLLALPSELRIMIYKLLLNPHPNRVHTLYDNIFGRVGPFHIDPTILQVNKQIYSEAVSILYDTASIHINFGWVVMMQRTGGGDDDPGSIYYPPALLRTDSKEAFRSANQPSWHNMSLSAKGSESEERLEPVRHPGSIYPHCFRRLRKIHLVISRYIIMNDSQCGNYFSPTGQTLLRILRVLAGERDAVKSPMMKRLKLTIQPNWRIVESQLRTGNAEMDEITKAIVGLLKALQRRTNTEVEMEEGAFTMRLKEWKMEDAEMDQWEKVLLADADVEY